jgi:hypothetical protein
MQGKGKQIRKFAGKIYRLVNDFPLFIKPFTSVHVPEWFAVSLPESSKIINKMDHKFIYNTMQLI